MGEIELRSRKICGGLPFFGYSRFTFHQFDVSGWQMETTTLEFPFQSLSFIANVDNSKLALVHNSYTKVSPLIEPTTYLTSKGIRI